MTIIALIPSPELAATLTVNKGIEADELHITLVHLSERKTLDMKRLQAVLQEFAVKHSPVKGRIGGTAYFSKTNDQGQIPAVLLYDSPYLPYFRQSLLGALEMHGFEITATHGYTPHMTLSFVKDAGKFKWPKGIEESKLTFDNVSIMSDDEIIDFPLMANRRMDKEDEDEAKSLPLYDRGGNEVASFLWDSGTVLMPGKNINPGKTLTLWGYQGQQLQSRSISYTDIGRRVLEAYNEQFLPKQEEDDHDVHIWTNLEEIFDDKAVIGVDNPETHNFEYWELSYVVGEGGEVTFGTPVEVRQTFELKSPSLKAGARHSKQDKGILQNIHDYTVDVKGASCEDYLKRKREEADEMALHGKKLKRERKTYSLDSLRDNLEADISSTLVDEMGEPLKFSIIEVLNDKVIVKVDKTHMAFPYAVVTGEDGKDGINYGEPYQVEQLFVPAKAVVPYQDLPLDERDTAWDASAAIAKVKAWAGGPDKEDIDWMKYRYAFLWWNEEDSENFGGYKLPIATIKDSKMVAVPKGISAAAGAMSGARGNKPDIPSDQIEGIENHINRYYKKMADKFDDDSIVSPFTKILNGNALKTISKTEDELRVGNYLALFGGRDLSVIVQGKNPDGSEGEFFTPNTEFESDFTKSVGRLAIDWEHRQMAGSKDEPGEFDVLGYVDWATKRIDKNGLFVERVLNRRNRYIQMLEELIDDGMIGTSSEAIGKQVVKGKDGEIKIWPLERDTLTVSPMEPRMMSSNTLEAIKSLVELGVLKEVATGTLPKNGGGTRVSHNGSKSNVLKLKKKQLEISIIGVN